jgi:phosphate uptake regulator
MKNQQSIELAMKADNSDKTEDRYVRRIQLTGRGSYVVSIPKHWVEQVGLKKGGRVEFAPQRGQGLLLMPAGQAGFGDEKTQCLLTIPPDADPNAVILRIISLYVIGYSTIEVNSKSGNLSPSLRNTIRDVARRKLVGTELVNESAKGAILQVLLGYPQLLVSDALRRMTSIMISMQQDGIQALANSDRELAKEVMKIDDEIDRFSLYIIRQLKWAVQHLPLLERIGLNSPVEILGYRIITKSIERSADHAARVAQNSLLVQRALDSTLLKEIKTLGEASAKLTQTAIQALFKQDYQLAESVLFEKEKISALESKLVKHLTRQKMPASELYALRLSSENLRRIGEYATDIAEVVLNLTVQKSTEPQVKTSTVSS